MVLTERMEWAMEPMDIVRRSGGGRKLASGRRFVSLLSLASLAGFSFSDSDVVSLCYRRSRW